MQEKRATDPTPITHFRSDRISLINGQYYFDTREGQFHGPFATREEALGAVEEYIQRCQRQESMAASQQREEADGVNG